MMILYRHPLHGCDIAYCEADCKDLAKRGFVRNGEEVASESPPDAPTAETIGEPERRKPGRPRKVVQ